MDNGTYEVSLHELLLVADGPPETVWNRALNAAFAAGQEPDPAESGTPSDEGAREADAATDTGDIADEQTLEPGSIDPDADSFRNNLPEVQEWDTGGTPQGDGDAAGY